MIGEACQAPPKKKSRHCVLHSVSLSLDTLCERFLLKPALLYLNYGEGANTPGGTGREASRHAGSATRSAAPSRYRMRREDRRLVPSNRLDALTRLERLTVAQINFMLVVLPVTDPVRKAIQGLKYRLEAQASIEQMWELERTEMTKLTVLVPDEKYDAIEADQRGISVIRVAA